MSVYEERFIFSCVYRRFNMEQGVHHVESKAAGRATETGITEAGASQPMLPPALSYSNIEMINPNTLLTWIRFISTLLLSVSMCYPVQQIVMR